MTEVQRCAELIRRRGKALALTGAGISVDSGIPDFRSAGGLWERFDPMEYATIEAFMSNPEKVWSMLKEMEDLLLLAEPNPGHLALAEMEKMGLLIGIITQNVDSLHQKAGSSRVIEFHGNARSLVCPHCAFRKGVEEYRANQPAIYPPRCENCHRIMKPDVVFFGEPIPTNALNESYLLLNECRVLLVIGTSAEVAPASLIPYEAFRKGIPIIEVNKCRTRISDLPGTISPIGSSSEILPAIVEAIRSLDGNEGYSPSSS